MTDLTLNGVRFGNATEQTTAEYPAFRNLIINGDMRISQRETSFTSANGYTLDRWVYAHSSASVATVTQNADVPVNSGLFNSLRATITTADTSIAAGDWSVVAQKIEGYNVADLVGVPITISFWVRSSKTGVHCVSLRNAGYDRSYVTEYTIITANTWENKTITISTGLTNSGTWNYTNGTGVEIAWALATGSSIQTTANSWNSANAFSTANQVNCLDTVGNIFAIAGVQVEKSAGATPFEFRNYELEYLLCQRYFSRSSASNRWTSPGGGQTSVRPLYWPVVMRSVPTVTFTDSDIGTASLNISSIAALNITQYGAGFAAVSVASGDAYAVYYTALANAEL